MSLLGEVPIPSGPSPNVPSKFHARAVHTVKQFLDIQYCQLHGLQQPPAVTSSSSFYSNTVSPSDYTSPFEIFNEFSGLQGIMPIDAAVYYNGDLLAFVEIDGDFHYHETTQMLRRKDKMKEMLYGVHYPNIPLFRIKSDQARIIGTKVKIEKITPSHFIIFISPHDIVVNIFDANNRPLTNIFSPHFHAPTHTHTHTQTSIQNDMTVCARPPASV